MSLKELPAELAAGMKFWCGSATGRFLRAELINIYFRELASGRRGRLLGFQSFQSGYDILQEGQALVDLPVPAVEFP